MTPLHRRNIMNEPASHGDGSPLAAHVEDETSVSPNKATKPTSDPPDLGEHTQRVFDASVTPHKEAETGMSFFITKAQKAELRRRGYSEEQIREMKPEDAHRALGLIG